MGDEEQQELIAPWDVTEDEIAALVSGIDRSRIVDLVKRTPHLQQHVFRGFRPSRLPWDHVPKRLARDAHGDPGRVKMLIAKWRESNRDLVDEVERISPDRIQEDVAELLAHRGVESKLQVLWALRLDDREEVQRALEAGLATELTAETSELLSRVEHNVLVAALKAAQTRATELDEKLSEAGSTLEDNQRLLQYKSIQLEALQAKIADLEEGRVQLLARADERAQVRETLEAELLAIQQQLAGEKATNAELRKSVRDLKTTLQIQIESSRQEETQQQLNEALLTLEEERRQTASLRLKLGRLEQRLESAYAKREEERERNDSFTQQLKKLEHAREVIIEQKRELTRRLEDLQSELDSARRQLRDEAVHEALEILPLSGLEDLWMEEREAVRDYLYALMGSLTAEDETPSSDLDKWELWFQWLEREAALVREVLSGLQKEASSGSVNSLRSAQQLLALRWYLLEYTRQAVLSALQESVFPL
jgi:chromosome segregation ATPase